MTNEEYDLIIKKHTHFSENLIKCPKVFHSLKKE